MKGDPCVVCGLKPSTGHYYGAFVCDSCRAFFKFYVDAGLESLYLTPECRIESDVPHVKIGEKIMCKQCRMRKCLAMGMDLAKGKNGKCHLREAYKTSNSQDKKEKKPTPASSKKSRLSLKGSKASSSEQGKSESPTPTSEPEKDSTETELEEEVKIPCVASLHNLGNTCFLNSVVQVLRYTRGFEEKVATLAREIRLTEKEIGQLSLLETKPEELQDLDLEEPLTWELVKNLHMVFRKMEAAEERFMSGSSFIAIRPYDLLETIGKLNPIFEGNLQQDSHEFLRCLLAYIQDASRELNKYRKKYTLVTSQQVSAPELPDSNEAVPLHQSQKEVEMLGGCKDSKPQTKRGKAEAKSPVEVKPRCSKRLSGSKIMIENAPEKEEQLTKDVASAGRKRRSLTELQNGQETNAPAQRLISDCFRKQPSPPQQNGLKVELKPEIENDAAAPSGEAEAADDQEKTEPPTPKQTSQDQSVAKPKTSSRLSKKRKAAESKSPEIASSQTPNRAVSPVTSKSSSSVTDKSNVSLSKKRKRCSSTGDLAAGKMIPQKLTLESLDPEACGDVGKKEETVPEKNKPDSSEELEEGQGEAQSVSADVQVKVSAEKKQTARKTFPLATASSGSDPLGNQSKAIVRLDKNGICKYFAKIAKPRSLSEIERNYSLQDDCVEEIFQGHMALRTRCLECETVTEQREAYQDVSVAVQQQEGSEDSDSEYVMSQICDVAAGSQSVAAASDSVAAASQSVSAVSEIVAAKSDSEVADTDSVSAKSDSVSAASESVSAASESVSAASQAVSVSDDSETVSEGITKEEKEEVENTGTTRDNDEEQLQANEYSWIRKSLGEVERLHDDNKFYCNQCNHLVEAERTMHYTGVPSVLTLHLKRFAMSYGVLGGFTKLTDHVPIPMILPCIEDKCSTRDKHRLELYAVVTHTGFSLTCGHYTAYIRIPPHSPALYDPEILEQAAKNAKTETDLSKSQEGESQDPSSAESPSYWFECDDEVVTVMEEAEFLARVSPDRDSTHTPYLLFYTQS